MQLTALEFKPLLGLPDGGGTHDSLEDEFTRRTCGVNVWKLSSIYRSPCRRTNFAGNFQARTQLSLLSHSAREMFHAPW